MQSYPPGILCYTYGGDCTETYGSGAPVTLTAYPEPGSYLEYWIAPSCTAPFPCIVTMDNDRVVEAHFAPSAPSLCKDSDGDGYGVCPACGTANTCAYNGNDCNDGNPFINPGMTEVNNFIDDDCDGIIDNALCSVMDSDVDGWNDCIDNCPFTTNAGQQDMDNDGYGDACDAADDNDGVPDTGDNCPLVANAPQSNIDCDALGDACDADIDGDGRPNSDEVAAGTSPTDADSDDDGISDGPTIPACATYNPRSITTTNDPYPLGPPRDEIIVEVRDAGGNNITATWLPALAWNSTAQRWDPGNVNIVARLKRASDGTYTNFAGNVTFSLTDVSRYEGIAMNVTETCGGDCPFDYSFDPANRDTHTTTVSATGAVNASAILHAFDFGGKARITATTTYNGNVVTGTIKIPLDTDSDDLPDKWETDNGLSAFSLNQDDRLADRDISVDNTYNGDGLNNFAEYRGFVFDKKSVSGPAEILTGTHKRFNPRKKDLFVRGDGYKNSTECVTAGTLPASCSVAGLLDFAIGNIGSETNFRNAFENAGIAVHDVTGHPSFTLADPFAEPPFVDIIVVKNDTVNTTTLVGSADGYINLLSIRYWTWDTKGAAYFGDADNYHYFRSATGTVSRGAFTYHLNLMNYFHNRPYWDSASTSGSYVHNAGYVGLLDPQSVVEDTKLEDGSLQKTNKTATNEDTSPNDTMLKGDHVKLGKNPVDPSKTDAAYSLWTNRSWGAQGYQKGYHFSTFDADGDGLVELPVVSDSKAISKEYTALHVQKQTIMHEMGHAAGIRNPEHPCETPNVMCIPVRNWDLADKFSGTAMSQIIIHNK